MLSTQEFRDKSYNIQQLLFSAPSLASHLITFFALSPEEKSRLLEPIALQFQKLGLTLHQVVAVLDTFSQNLLMTNIDSRCDEIRCWLLDNQDQEDGSWPLAQGNTKNAWANAVCILSLLKFLRFVSKDLAPHESERYYTAISKGIRWLFESEFFIANGQFGWKQHATDDTVNIYDTSIALRAVFKYRAASLRWGVPFSYSIPDSTIPCMVQYLMGLAEGNTAWPDKPLDSARATVLDTGATSYALMTLVHFLNTYDEHEIDIALSEQAQSAALNATDWLIKNYEADVGWRQHNGAPPSLAISCYALQALNKSKDFLLARLMTEDGIEMHVQSTLHIITAEMLRIQSSLVRRGELWGWPDDDPHTGDQRISLINTSLATSTLLKCSLKSSIDVDLSVILKTINSLLGSFNNERITLDNTYILCTIMDYLLYRIHKNLIF